MEKVTNSPGVVVVTGAGRGIGLSTTKMLLANGYTVVALDVFESVGLGYEMAEISDLDNLLSLHRETLVVLHGDVRVPKDLERAVEVAEELGGLGGAIACAGVIAGSPFSFDLDPEYERAILDINLGGVINLARAAIGKMVINAASTKWGRFIAISSVAASKPLPRLGAYVASKQAVTGYVRTLALELSGTFVTANLIAPGSTNTSILAQSAKIYDLIDPQAFAQQHTTGALIEPDEIAMAALYLCTRAARSVTGTTLTVDAGLGLT